MNIVVGYAGLLDLGYVAFYAVGAYLFALLTSPHLSENFAWFAAAYPAGLHTPWWVTLPLCAGVATVLGVVIGAPTLKLRGDYLAIVTLGFGEIVRLLLINLGSPVNITHGAKGIGPIDAVRLFGWDLGEPVNFGNHFGSHHIAPVTLYYYLFLTLVVLTVILCSRLQGSRIGRAWQAIRDDEMAAQAMGINTRNLKLLAFGIGASFGGVAGALFAAFQGFVSPEAFSLQESVVIVAMVVFGGIGHIPGVILGAPAAQRLAGSAALRGRALASHDGRPDRRRRVASAADFTGHDHHHAGTAARGVAGAGGSQAATLRKERRVRPSGKASRHPLLHCITFVIH